MIGRRSHASRKPALTIAQKKIEESGLVTRLRIDSAGHKAAPKWRRKYQIKDTQIFLYLMPNDIILIQDGKGGKSLSPQELWERSSAEVQDLIENLGLLPEGSSLAK